LRILFIYPNRSNWYGEAPLGVLYLSAVLENAGHKTDLFDLTPYPANEKIVVTHPNHQVQSYSYARDLLSRIREFKPDFVAFSVINPHLFISVALSNLIKNNYDLPIIFGGHHPTANPEDTISQKSVDMICVGEGEEAMLELVSKWQKGEDYKNVQNIWVKIGEKIFRNPPRPPIQNLDDLPLPNRDLLDPRHLSSEMYGANFITGRGCPFQCTYCHNVYLQNLYKGLGRYVRFREIKYVIDEIKYVIERYNIRKLTFSDDTFTLDKKRTMEFCRIYKKEIGLPFICQTRVDTINRELLEALKDAGCEQIDMGIEAGDDYLRRSILNRHISRAKIFHGFKLAKKIGLRTASFNMIGIPFETNKTVRETIEINRAVGPYIALCTLFAPFRKTKLGDFCHEKGWIKSPVEKLHGYYYDTVLELPSISRKELIGFARFFTVYVKSPMGFDPFIDLLRYIYMSAPSKRLRTIIDFGIGIYLSESDPPKGVKSSSRFVAKKALKYIGILKDATT